MQIVIGITAELKEVIDNLGKSLATLAEVIEAHERQEITSEISIGDIKKKITTKKKQVKEESEEDERDETGSDDPAEFEEEESEVESESVEEEDSSDSETEEDGETESSDDESEEEEQEEPAAKKSAKAKSDSKGPSVEDVIKQCQVYAKAMGKKLKDPAKGREAAKKVLAKFGVKSSKDLSPEQRVKAIKLLTV